MDLNSTLFYKAKFDIESTNENTDLLWKTICEIRNWIGSKWEKRGEPITNSPYKWTQFKFGREFSSQNESVYLKSVYHLGKSGSQDWACKIVESYPSQSGCAPREWTTEIGFQQIEQTRATISLVLYYNDRPGFIGHCEEEPSASIPGIVRRLCKGRGIKCLLGNSPFCMEAQHLKPGDFPDFWKTVCDAQRDIPVIYISPKGSSESENGENLIDPKKLVERLGPNALVYYADDVDFSREMTLLCKPEKFGCYSGNIRIYLPHPHIDEVADSYRHRILYAKDIVGNEESVYKMLRRALAQDIHFYEVMFRIEDCKTLNEKDVAESRRNEYRQKIEEELLEINARNEEECQNALRTELEKFENERFNWEVEKERYEEVVRELKEKNYSLQVQEGYRQQAVQSEAKNMIENLRNLPSYPKTPEEIANFFEGHFSDRLAFTKRGRNSLQECTTMPEILWDALYQMATKLYDLYMDDNVKSVESAFNNASNLHMARGEGKMTRKDPSLMRQYEDEYEGRNINIEPHIKTSESKASSSKFLRVYFCFDEESKKIVIGSCGKHLNNYTTRKI